MTASPEIFFRVYLVNESKRVDTLTRIARNTPMGSPGPGDPV